MTIGHPNRIMFLNFLVIEFFEKILLSLFFLYLSVLLQPISLLWFDYAFRHKKIIYEIYVLTYIHIYIIIWIQLWHEYPAWVCYFSHLIFSFIKHVCFASFLFTFEHIFVFKNSADINYPLKCEIFFNFFETNAAEHWVLRLPHCLSKFNKFYTKAINYIYVRF